MRSSGLLGAVFRYGPGDPCSTFRFCGLCCFPLLVFGSRCEINLDGAATQEPYHFYGANHEPFHKPVTTEVIPFVQAEHNDHNYPSFADTESDRQLAGTRSQPSLHFSQDNTAYFKAVEAE